MCLAKLPSPNSLGKSKPSTLLSGDSCRTGGIQEFTTSQTSLVDVYRDQEYINVTSACSHLGHVLHMHDQHLVKKYI